MRTTETTHDPLSRERAQAEAAAARADNRTYGDGRARTTDGHARRSPGSLIRELATDGRDLVRLELELAKTEMREKVEVYERNAMKMAMGGGLLLAALVFGLTALNNGLTVVLSEWMGLEIGAWLAPLLLFVVIAAIGWGMISSARDRMQRESLKPRRTIETLKDDKRWAKEQMHA